MIKTVYFITFILTYLAKDIDENACLMRTSEGFLFDLTPLMRMDSFYEVRDPSQDSSFFRLAYGNHFNWIV